MDIDFHFWATYTAARFADLNHERAMKIASSAQMVDENALGAIEAGVKKDAAGADMWAGRHYFRSIPIKEEAKDPPIIDYQIIQSFQTISGIAMSTNICYKAYWPVFHFLPGNFEPSHYPGELKAICDTFWRKRWPCQNQDKNFLDHFPWLTRPYSPMAIQLINNCCGLVNNPASDIAKYGLEDYLIGITMHVFIDTWAHQDFVGYTAYSINGINGKPRIDSHKVKRGIFNKQEEFAGTQDKLVIRRFGEEASTWLGHGPAGHWPDHSALKFTYTPNWSNREITRDNPKEYMEAFVNMVEAIRCIVGNKNYYPITVDDARRSEYGRTNLKEVEKLINFPRYQDGSGEEVSFGKGARRDKDLNRDWIETLTTVGFKRADPWDLNMYYFNAQWRNFIHSVYDEAREIPDWIPGQSVWMAQAKDASKKNWITPEEFRKLDYFKFNVAAKFHFRSVQQQLKAFGQQLLGDWPAGFAYADDLAAISAVARGDEKKSQILFALRETQRTSKKVDDQEIITVLIRQVEDASYVNEARQILKNALDDHAIRGSLDAKTVDSLKKISGYQNISVQLKSDGHPVYDADPDVNHFISIISSEVAINSFASSLKESVDDYLKKSKGDPKSVGVRRALSFKEELGKQSTYASDGSYTESDLGDLIFNLFVNNRIGNQSFAGVLGLGGGIQTNENSLFTCAVNALINNPLFIEASGGPGRKISSIPANRKLMMKSGYAAKGESMCLRRLLFRLLDLPRNMNSSENYSVSAKDAALLLHAVKSR